MSANLTVNQLQSLDSFFKPLFADQVISLIPSRELFTLNIPFLGGTEKGGSNEYIVPVILNREHGATFHGSTDAHMKLNPPTVSQPTRALVRSSAITMRSFLSVIAAQRALKSETSFIDATSYVVENLVESFSAIVEQINWYGGSGLGQSASLAGEIGANVPGYTFDANGVDATLRAVRIAYAEWAPAIWVGAEGMPVEIYNAAGTVLIQKAVIDGVDILNRIFILSDVVGLTAAAGANVGFRIWRKGTKGYEADGVHSILTNSTSLFGIASGVTGLWFANSFAVASGGLSLASITAGVTRAYARGLESDLQLHISSSQFAKLMGTFTATVSGAGGASLTTFSNPNVAGGCCRVDDNGNLVYGMRTMKFIINSIEVEVVVNDYVKNSYAYGLDLSSWKRVGTNDIQFQRIGLADGQYFFPVSETNAVEIRMNSDQAPFCDRPARNIIFTGLTEPAAV